MNDLTTLTLEEQIALVEDAVDLNSPLMQKIAEDEEHIADIETAWEAYDVLKETMDVLQEYETRGETPPDEIVAVATESMPYHAFAWVNIPTLPPTTTPTPVPFKLL